MISALRGQLKTWIESLDTQIGDTQSEIDKRRQTESRAVNVRKDVQALLNYIEKVDLPEDVERALIACLAWNPHAKENIT